MTSNTSVTTANTEYNALNDPQAPNITPPVHATPRHPAEGTHAPRELCSRGHQVVTGPDIRARERAGLKTLVA